MLEQGTKWYVLNGKHLALCHFHKGPTLPLLQVCTVTDMAVRRTLFVSH